MSNTLSVFNYRSLNLSWIYVKPKSCYFLQKDKKTIPEDLNNYLRERVISALCL